MCGWLSTIPGFTADTVTLQLPPEAQWVTNGAVTVLPLGGKPSPTMAWSTDMLQVECWASNIGSDKLPWGKAFSLAMQIRLASLDRQFAQRTVSCTNNGIEYPAAAVRTVVAITQPHRIYGTPSDYAAYATDYAVTWSQAGLTTR